MWKEWEIKITVQGFFNQTFSNVPIIWLATYLILLSTDLIDGALARKYKTVSSLGATLDTIGDFLALAMGASLCFAVFVRDKLTVWQFWVYVGIILTVILCKFFVFFLSKIYHGKGNMIHTFYHKLFAVCAYISIFFWAFLRTIPEWTIYPLLVIIIIAAIDESVYIVRTAEYNITFKGHGFDIYKKRRKI